MQALKWAREEWKVDMISMSFGFQEPGGEDLVKTEVENCLNNKISVFASASNDGDDAERTYPAKYERVICVHSTSGLGNPSDFNPTADTGKNMDNFAVLGEGIKSAWPVCLGEGTGKQRMSGTSFATPVAVSIAAFWIGYIRTRKQLKGLGWNKKPQSPEGVKAIFNMLSEGPDNKSDGYDLISTRKFVTRNRESLICEMLMQRLGAYHISS